MTKTIKKLEAQIAPLVKQLIKLRQKEYELEEKLQPLTDRLAKIQHRRLLNMIKNIKPKFKKKK